MQANINGKDLYLQTGFLFPPAVTEKVETEDRLSVRLLLYGGRESHVIQLQKQRADLRIGRIGVRGTHDEENGRAVLFQDLFSDLLGKGVRRRVVKILVSEV